MTARDLVVHADKVVGDLRLSVEMRARGGSVTAILGPNGAGKSTLLRCIAGALAVDAGVISLGGVDLDRPPDVFVRPADRHVGVLHQEHLLFPHLSVLDNVAFGPRARGADRAAARAVATTVLTRFDLDDLAPARPSDLSGGQAQRVALARALAAAPRALLLDEPLTALDAQARSTLRQELRRYTDDFPGPTLLVTHDPVDALTLADEVVVIEAGRVTQSGPLTEVTARPRSRYVADLVGTNLVRATGHPTDATRGTGAGTGSTVTAATGVRFHLAERVEGDVFVVLPPRAVALHRSEPDSSARNRWPARVAHLELLGDRVRVQLAAPLGLVAEVTPAAVAELTLHEGAEIWASAKATELTAYAR